MSFDQVDYLCAMLLRKLLVPLAFLVLCGCEESSLFQKVVFMPNQSWGYSNPTSFAFTISDTASRYRVFFVLRHTDAYEYNNIWINMASQLPGDSIWRKDRFNIPLANEKGGWEQEWMIYLITVYCFILNLSHLENQVITNWRSGRTCGWIRCNM